MAVKAYYLGAVHPWSVSAAVARLESLAAISYVDVWFVAILAGTGWTLLRIVRRSPLLTRGVSALFVLVAACCAIYAVANVIMFGIFGGFLTYPLLALVGDVRMVRSSVAAHATPHVMLSLAGLPLVYLGLVAGTIRICARSTTVSRRGLISALAFVIAWTVLGQYSYASVWSTRADRRIAENAHWLLVSSWAQAVHGDGAVRMGDRFADGDLSDFAPIGEPPERRGASLTSAVLHRASALIKGRRAPVASSPPNVILIVLESVAARWSSLTGGMYDTTPILLSESSHAAVFDSVYAPIGRSSNSLAAMLLSIYPKLDFRDLTEEYPSLQGTSLARLFQQRGYRTVFATPSDLHWAGWEVFLRDRGFDAISDYRNLSCPEMLSSWGVEDRCMVDALLPMLATNTGRPFFFMGWTTQTHHPYEPSPGVPLLNLVKEPVQDEYDLGRYLNVLHETDRQIGRIFDALRRSNLDQNTIVIVTGDHGQAFGYPHDTYIQGRTVYEEDVNVPLMIWSPKLYRTPVRSDAIGSLIDLAPTIADVAGLQTAPAWQGRSLFDSTRSERAYFYVAEDHFTLGVREGKWKYIFALREGSEELYDLDRDPTEQHNLASAEPERCARLRQRLAAWAEANRRQYSTASLVPNP